MVEDSSSDWRLYMEQADEDYYDFSDIQMVVYELRDDGTLSHLHVNPLYLEPLLEIQDKNAKGEIEIKTLWATGKHFENPSIQIIRFS